LVKDPSNQSTRNVTLPIIAMAYVSVKLVAILLFYKVVTLFGITAAASTLVIPLWFFLGDVITEVYGYKIAKRLVYASAFFQLLFGLLAGLFNHLNPTNVGIDQAAYSAVLGNLPRGAFASFLAIIIGGIVNSYALNKWKLSFKGRFFLIRSLLATTLGELVFTSCVYLTGFYQITSLLTILKLICISYLIKIICNPIMVIPALLLVKCIKNYENDNAIDPFIIKPSAKITKLYTGIDGKSYFMDEVISTSIQHVLGWYSEPINISKFQICEIIASSAFNLHNAPQLQYIIYLSCEVEIIASSGETRRFKPGDILLATDTTGTGHITKVISTGMAIVIRSDY
jgi:hypothetical protein